MNQEIEIIEADPIGDLRRALNQEMFDKEQFHKLTNVLKVMPELYEMAKKND
jgi:predicted translin family RNA/ssDNA-binding protein